jgi:outer membrane protein TolC
LIQVERSKRALDFAEEQLKLEILNNLRALDQAKRNLANAELGITLAERRVEEQELRMQLGRGVTRDLLDAQADLNQARNARTAAIVSHSTARLRFFRDLGILYIKPDGRWEPLPEVAPVKTASTSATPNNNASQ